MDDLDLLKQSLISARSTLPLNLQIKGVSTDETKQSKSSEQKNTEDDLSEEMEEIVQKLELFDKGYEALMDRVKERAQDNRFQAQPKTEWILVDSLLVDEDSYEMAIEELLDSNFDHSTQLYEILEYDEAILLNLYEVATQFYNEAQIEEALCAFIFLTYVHPGISSFWKGLGLSYERNQNQSDAMEAYKKAAERTSEFSPYQDMIRCCEGRGGFDEVLEILEKLKEKGLFQDEVENAFAYIAKQSD
ncbi:hypothetical protein N9Y92_02485 [Chlamydiales bacterium]|nr:hypothetical protein [Chlamydiales bacterium]